MLKSYGAFAYFASKWESFKFLTIKFDVNCSFYVDIIYSVEDIFPHF